MKCMYCKKEYLPPFRHSNREKRSKCCNECRKVRDWCQTEECNNKSLLVTGYPPNNNALAIFSGPKINRCIEEYIKNNQEELQQDPYAFMNFCCKHFEERVGYK